MPKLLLFDIDGTLVDTGGEGGLALLDAVEEVLETPRERVPPLQLAGATDGGITRQLFSQLGFQWCDQKAGVYLQCYLKHLEVRLRRPHSPAILLPGAEGLLKDLADSENIHLGLLTGNLKAGAEIKLRQFDVWHHFISGAFADDAEDRNLLGPFALERMQEATGASYSMDEIFVIGDTPKDIACAHAFGARCIAVTTGSYDRASLESHKPWAILDSLAGGGLHQLLSPS